jgi:hypothetical protein
MACLIACPTKARFRHLLKRHDLITDMLRIVVNDPLQKSGTAVDATLISAPSSTKNVEGKRDPEMHQTKTSRVRHQNAKICDFRHSASIKSIT